MNNDRYQAVGLYEHNITSYQKIEIAYASGENIVAIVHATSTGKTYNGEQLAYDNPDKKIIYMAPLTGIIDHIKETINNNPNLDFERDFPNLQFQTYQSLINLSREELANIQCDILILDEFHHLGLIWGSRIKTIIETHPNMKVLGMTAYTVINRSTPYERDMVDPDTDEIFSGKVVSRYDICDAMIDGIMPKPIYKSAHHLIKLVNELETRLQKQNPHTKEYQECLSLLSDVKKRIHEAPSIPSILKKNIKPNGKYIYFCPPTSEKGTNDIETIKKQALEWFKQYIPEEDIIFYTSTSNMGKEGKRNRDAFYNDVTLDGKNANHKLRIMFAINQYNEGIHAPNIDGVIMGRGTSSDIVFFEQLGRALVVKGNIKEKFDALEKYTLEELTEMCESRDIPIKENEEKEDIIQKLIAPVIIDLADNYSYIKELENNLQNRIKEIQQNSANNHRHIKIKDVFFDIEIENQDLFETLIYIRDRLTMTWFDYYELAKIYYNHHGDSLINASFKTINGYEYNEKGLKLGLWIKHQRTSYDKLNDERKKLLSEINFIVNSRDYIWFQYYKLAQIYYNYYGNSLIPRNFITINGYEHNDKGLKVGKWITTQRERYGNLSDNRKKLLAEINFIVNIQDYEWNQYYELAKSYYNHHGNLLIPLNFKTINGYKKNKDGLNLGQWLYRQRQRYDNLSDSRKKLLSEINFIINLRDYKWYQYYELAKAYYNHYGNLLIPQHFTTINGYEENIKGLKLGNWIMVQRQKYNDLSEERKQLLLQIAFIVKPRDYIWTQFYKLAKAYYNHYGNLLIPQSFKTINGYEENKKGVKLGQWITMQRTSTPKDSERGRLLSQIGMVWEVRAKRKTKKKPNS